MNLAKMYEEINDELPDNMIVTIETRFDAISLITATSFVLVEIIDTDRTVSVKVHSEFLIYYPQAGGIPSTVIANRLIHKNNVTPVNSDEMAVLKAGIIAANEGTNILADLKHGTPIDIKRGSK